MKKQFSLIKSGLLVSIITLGAKVFSFVRDMLMARYLGATELSDIILTSTTLVLVLTTFLRSSFAAAYLPIATDKYLTGDENTKKSFFGSIYGTALSVGIIIALIEAILIEPLIKLFAPGFTGNQFELLKVMMLIQLPVVAISFVSVVNNENLRLLNKFGVSEVSTSLISIFYIIYLLAYQKNTTAVTISIFVDLAYFAAFLFTYFFLVREKFVYKWIFNLSDTKTEIKTIFMAMIPFMISNGAKEINIFVDKAIGSLLSPGSITMQSYASKMTVTEVGLIATAISLVIFSQASKLNTYSDSTGLKSLVIDGLDFVNVLMLPCCALTIIFRYDIISLLFGHGQFGNSEVIITANTMMIYAIGMFGSGIEAVLLNIMYATKHRKFPMYISLITILFNLILNLILYKPYGIYGLAAASSFVQIIKIPAYYLYTKKKIVNFQKTDRIFQTLFHVILATCGLSIVCMFLNRLALQSINTVASFLISAVVGCICYFAILIIEKNKFALRILNAVKAKIKR